MRKNMSLYFLIASLIPLVLFGIVFYFYFRPDDQSAIFIYIFLGGIAIAIILAMSLALWIVKNLAKPLRHIINQAQIIATGNFSQPIEIERSDEIGELAYTLEMTRQRLKKSREEIESWNQVLEERVRERTEAFEKANKKLKDSYANLEKLTTELEAKNKRLDKEIYQGRLVQMSMLPSAYPEKDGWDFYGASVPAPVIGGDYFDFLETEDGKLGLALGDVSGSGITAAMVMAMAKSSLYTQVPNDSNPNKVFSVLNKVMQQVAESGRVLTFFYGLLEIETGEFIYTNAGHEPPFLFAGEHNQPDSLKATSPPIGTNESWQFKTQRVKLSENDVLVLYTDGVMKAESEDGEQFGRERFEEVLIRSAHLNSADIINEVFEELSIFCGTTKQVDDITMLVVKRAPKP